jgi:hypothetical protein
VQVTQVTIGVAPARAVSKFVINRKKQCRQALRPSALFSTIAVMAALISLAPATKAAENTAAPTSRSGASSSVLPSKKPSMPRPASADKDYKNERLTTFIDLPDLPKYSGAGAVFIDGFRYPNDTFGQGVMMTFGVMEQSTQVNDWYKAALQQYQWTLATVKTDPKNAGSYGIEAGKGKYNISLVIKPAIKAPYRTRVVLRYKFGK